VFIPTASTAPLLTDDGSYSGSTMFTEGWTFLVGGPDDLPLSTSERDALASAGFTTSAPGEDTWSMSGAGGQDAQLIALLVVCLLIEIVLLAGPAFAVGVRRQRHSLALLAVAGGSPRDIRRTVLAQAVILGLAASVIGAVVAIPLTWAGLWVLAAGWGEIIGPFDIGWIAVLPAIVLGTLSAVLAALIPARIAARADVGTALAGRQPAPKVKRGWPILGIAVLALGTLGCLSSLGRSYGGFANAWWAVVSVCGAVMMTPWLISLIARLAPLLPLPLRLALRDANRHRSRSAPAVAAVMASVSAVVALGIGSASDQASSQFDPEYRYPLGTVTLSAESPDQMAATVAAIKDATGVTFTPLARVDDVYSVPTSDVRTPENAYTIAIADPAVLEQWGVELSDAAAAQLSEGRALVDPSVVISHGTVEVSAWADDGTATAIRIPASRVDLAMDGDVPGGITPIVAGIVVSPETARAFGLTSTQGIQEAIADERSSAITPEVRAAAAGVSLFGWSINTVTKQHSDYWLLLGLLSLLAVFTVLLGTFSATGLAIDDARHDLATLSAVGARPATRRLVAGTHAFLIALLGAVLGIAVGFTPGITAAYLLTTTAGDGWVLRIPWLLLLLLVVILPIVAGGVTAVVSRPRTISLRRAA
jgi:putative ABC transport system permease protein